MVDVDLPGSSNAMLIFRHPGATNGRLDRYAWFISRGPEARSVTSRLSTSKVLDALSDDAMIKPFLDDVLEPLFQRRHPQEELIRAFAALTVTDGVIEMQDVADRLGIETHALRRLATRHFGMLPKMLLRRARFLRSFIRLIRPDGHVDYSAIDSSYFDASHFLRDATTFLGTTPRRFLASETLFLKSSLRARAAVIGTPTQALHIPTPPVSVSSIIRTVHDGRGRRDELTS